MSLEAAKHGRSAARSRAHSSNKASRAPLIAALALGLAPAFEARASDAAHEPGAAAAAQTASVPCGSIEGLDVGPRLASLVAQRRAKCAEIRRYRPTFLERQILAFEKAERPAINEVNLFGLYPRAQTLDHRSQLAGGARLWRPDLGDSAVDLSGSAFWSLQGFRYHEVQVGVIPHRGTGLPAFAGKTDDVFELPHVRLDHDRPYMLYGSLAYRWAPKFDFFGVGPDSRFEDRAGFRQKDLLYEILAGRRVWRRLTLSARAGYYVASLGPGQDDELPDVGAVFAPPARPGFESQPDFLRYGAGAVFDSRDFPGNPRSGAILAVQWQRHDQRGGDAQSFDRFAVDARGYLPLGRRQRVLALRAYASWDDPGTGRVPFYLQAFLGNSHTLRAFVSQRFRGEKLALLQAEYRWTAAPALELAAFVEAGTVAARSADAFSRWRTDGGFGLRFKTHVATPVRCDFAWGDEGLRVLFRFSQSF